MKHFLKFIPASSESADSSVGEFARRDIVRLQFGGLTRLEPIKHQMIPLVSFQVKDYVNIVGGGSKDEGETVGWDATYAPVNAFLEGLNENQQEMIVSCYALCKNIIERFFASESKENLTKMALDVSSKLADLDRETNLIDEMRKFVDTHVNIHRNYDKAGTRDQDTELLTFRLEHVKEVIVLALVCKMVSPLFGCIIRNIKADRLQLAPVIHCMTILEKLLQGKLKDIHHKSSYYVSHTMRKVLDAQATDETKMTMQFNGYTINNLARQLYAQLLVRNLVNIDLMDPNSDIPKYMYTVTKKGVASLLQELTNKAPVQTRHDDNSALDDNTAQSEVDSLISEHSLDLPTIIRTNVWSSVRSVINGVDIPESKVNAAVASANKHAPVRPNDLNKMLNCALFGDRLDGGESIFLLQKPEYTILTITLQLLAVEFGHLQVAHLITHVDPVMSKNTYTDNDHHILANYGTSSHFKTLLAQYDQSLASGTIPPFTTIAKKMIEGLVGCRLTYNTAPWLWTAMGQDNSNGLQIDLERNIASEIWQFMNEINALRR